VCLKDPGGLGTYGLHCGIKTLDRALEALALAAAVTIPALTVGVLPVVRRILDGFGSEVPWPTKMLMASEPFYAALLAVASALALVWLAERAGLDALGARLRGLIPGQWSRHKTLILCAIIALYFLCALLNVVAAYLPQFQGSLAGG